MKRKMRLFRNKKGYSTGFTWVFGLVTLFGLGIMYVVFNQVFMAHLVPVIKNQVNATNIAYATQAQINGEIDKFMAFFHILPYVLFFLVVLYMLFAAIRKEREESY